MGEIIGESGKFYDIGFRGIFAVCKDQILQISVCDEYNKVVDMVRYDATDNNIGIIKDIIKTGIVKEDAKLDEFKEGNTKKALQELLELSDAIGI